MKEKIQKEFYKRVRQLKPSKLHDGKTIKAINSQSVFLVRYSARILKWTKDELKVMDRKTREIMTTNRMFTPQSGIDRPCIPRMEGERGLLGIVGCRETEEQNLSFYLDQSEERLLRFSKSKRIFPEYEGHVSTAKKQKKEERHKQWKDKHLRRKSVREKEEIRSKEKWEWIRNYYLKKETESLIFIA